MRRRPSCDRSSLRRRRLRRRRRRRPGPAEGPDWIPFDDPRLQQVLHEDRGRRRLRHPRPRPQEGRELRATRSDDVEPYGGVKPYKENFLTQMEYSGAGRAIPEPEGLEDGEDRLHRADHVHRLGRHRRQEPRGGARHQDAARARSSRSRSANARGGYLKRKIPFELVVEQRQRPVGLVGQRDHQAGLQGQGLGHPRHDRRRQQPHRDPRRAQGRGRDDEHAATPTRPSSRRTSRG